MTVEELWTATKFKTALKQAAFDAGHSTLASIEELTELSHGTVSRAFGLDKPMPTEKTVRVVVAKLGGDPEIWLERYQAASEHRPRAGSPRWSRSKRFWFSAGAGAIVLAASVVVAVRLTGRDDAPTLTIEQPHGTVGPMTLVSGRYDGPSTDELWLDVQSVAERRHHTTDAPCTREGDRFSLSPLYVGQAADHNVEFRISVVVVREGSSAAEELRDYADRPKNSGNPYIGLAQLPKGATSAVSILVIRR